MGTLSYKGNLEIGTEKLPYSPQTTRHGERQSLVFCKKFCIFYFMNIFSMSNNHLFFFGGKIRTFSSELASVFFRTIIENSVRAVQSKYLTLVN